MYFNISIVRERQGTTARGPRVPPSQRETETNSRVGCMRKISVDVLSVCMCMCCVESQRNGLLVIISGETGIHCYC